jgi:PKD repeat protein
MATPIVNVSFTADVRSGIPPFDVQFTDTTEITDGVAKNWFWNFGDGTMSTEQHPSHTFDGELGDKWTVKLTVIATAGQSPAYQDKNAIATAGGTWQSGFAYSNDEAWEDFLADSPSSWDSIWAAHNVRRTGGQDRQYTRTDCNFTVSTSFTNGVHILTVNPSTATIFQGAIISNGKSFTPTSSTIRQSHSLLDGMVSGVPLALSGTVMPNAKLPDTPLTNQHNGQNVSFGCRTYYNHSLQSSEEHEEVDFITTGSAPIAAFTAFPIQGLSPLSVQFENLSTLAVGAPTTWSWRRRVSGSGDAFVQFSTAENPSQDFEK